MDQETLRLLRETGERRVQANIIKADKNQAAKDI